MLLASIADAVVPALKDPEVRRRVGLGLYAALADIVPMTAYVVTGNRVMDLSSSSARR